MVKWQNCTLNTFTEKVLHLLPIYFAGQFDIHVNKCLAILQVRFVKLHFFAVFLVKNYPNGRPLRCHMTSFGPTINTSELSLIKIFMLTYAHFIISHNIDKMI